MSKSIKLIAKKYDDNNVCKDVEVIYHFGCYRETNCAYIWCEYEGEGALWLTIDCANFENKAWALMYFHAPMYWLAVPLLMAGVVKINYQTSCAPENKYRSMILVEVAEEYMVYPDNDADQ